jgi:hypothetical protein
MVVPGGPIRDVRLGGQGSSGAAAPPTSTAADISTHPLEAPTAASSMADNQLMPGGLALSPAAADGALAGAADAGWRSALCSTRSALTSASQITARSSRRPGRGAARALLLLLQGAMWWTPVRDVAVRNTRMLFGVGNIWSHRSSCSACGPTVTRFPTTCHAAPHRGHMGITNNVSSRRRCERSCCSCLQ